MSAERETELLRNQQDSERLTREFPDHPEAVAIIRLPEAGTDDGAKVLSVVQVTPPDGNKIAFDSFGSPGAATITLNTTAGNITVTKNTGFIP